MLHVRRSEDRGRTDLGWLDSRRRAARRYFALLASKDGRNESLQVRQDVDLWMALIDPGETRVLPLRPGRHAWIQVVRGSITVNGSALAEGDGASMSDEQFFTLIGCDHAEVLLFDLA
jgi:redox-sensitive bicupin YhaK (pirin superfamily)